MISTYAIISLDQGKLGDQRKRLEEQVEAPAVVNPETAKPQPEPLTLLSHLTTRFITRPA